MKKQGGWQAAFHAAAQKGTLSVVGKVAAGAASVTALSVGGNALWKQVQQGTLFRPELFANSQELHGNQITFPNNEEYKQKKQPSDSGENEMLQKDRTAEDKSGKVKDDPTSYEVDAEDPNSFTESLQNVLIAPGDLTGSDVPQQNLALGADTVFLTKNDGKADETLHRPGESHVPGSGPSGSTTAGSDNTGSGGDSSAGTGGSGNGGSAVTPSKPDNPSTPDNPSKPDTPSTPDTPAVPDTPVTPDNPDTPSYDPDYPDDSKQPQLPPSPTLPDGSKVFPAFPEDGISEDNHATLRITDVYDADSDFLYQGAVLTDWKLLCSVLAFVQTDEGSYRLTSYSDCFKIGEHPDVAEEGLTVSFYFRPNVKSEWQEIKHTFYVRYAKLVVMNAADEDGNQTPLRTEYLDKGDTVRLSQLTRYLYKANEDWGEENLFWSTDRNLDQIFPGWSLEEDGELLHTLVFEPDKGGRYILYPKERQPLPEGFSAVYQTDWDPFDDNKYVGRQILNGLPKEMKDLVIPEGIQEVAVYFLPTDEEDMLNSITLPESVDTMPNIPAVLEGYRVSPYNHVFIEKDGALYNHDKTELLGIPIEKTEIDVPASVNRVELNQFNRLESITLHSQTPPQMDVSELHGTKIYIPLGSYMNYIAKWGHVLPDDVTLETDEAENRDFVVTDDGIFSGDMTVLYRASEESCGMYQVPEGVTRIAADAFAETEYVDSVYLPASVTRLDTGSLNNPEITRIYFEGEVPPEISEDSFDLDEEDSYFMTRIWTPYGCVDTYRAAWSSVLGEERTEDLFAEGFILREENGIRYLEAEEDGATLLEVPDEITSFDEINELAHPSMDWCRIGMAAFGSSSGMEMLELPDTVTEIGMMAFVQCQDLTVVVSHATDNVYVGKDAFPNMKIAAFDSTYVIFEDGTTVSGMLCLLPVNATVGWMDGDAIQPYGWGSSYVVEDAGEGKILYSILDREDGPVSYLLQATSDVSGEILAPEGYPLTEIRPTAMQECSETFSFPASEIRHLHYIGSNAFMFSGISGDLVLSGEIESIGTDVFYGCDQLDEILFEEGDYAARMLIGDMAFEYSSIKRIVFPENLYNLGSLVFQGCNQLEEVVFTSEEPPILATYSYGSPYQFGWENSGIRVQISLADDSYAENYRDVWKYYMMGYEVDIDRDYVWMDKLNSLLFQLMYGWGDADVDAWPDDQPVFEDDGVTYQENFLEYWYACADYVTDQLYYNAEWKVCELLGLDVPEEPEFERPDVSDYVDSEIPDEIVIELPDIATPSDLPDVEDPSTDQIISGESDAEIPDEDITGDVTEDDTENKDTDSGEETAKKPDAGEDSADKDIQKPDTGNGDPDEDADHSDAENPGRKDDSENTGTNDPDAGDSSEDISDDKDTEKPDDADGSGNESGEKPDHDDSGKDMETSDTGDGEEKDIQDPDTDSGSSLEKE